jgi:AcrR family transcriptional regulator
VSEEKHETKEKLLDAAESLFACKGFEDVSIRELATEANVNVAAVNYHFQGKENLFHQVIMRRFVLQRDRTLEALETVLGSSEEKPGIAPVIHTLVEEYLKGTLSTPGGGSFMMLLAREMHSPHSHSSSAFFKEMVMPVFRAYSTALMDVRPCLKQDQINWVMASIIGQIHHFVARWHKKTTFEEQSEEVQIMIKVFPALGQPVEQYIEMVTDHITAFSTAAIDSLYPEVPA